MRVSRLLLLVAAFVFAFTLAACEEGEDGEDGQDGEDGREVELDTDEENIVWRYEDEDEWRELIALEVLEGTDGEDGREVELRTEDDTVEWRLEEGEWSALIDLEDLEGADGEDGTDGMSAFEIYQEYHDYEYDEEQWIDDLVNGRLADVETHNVAFDPGEGDLDPDYQSVKEIEHGETLEMPTATHPEYAFGGWVTGEGPNDKHFTDYDPILEDLTLHADWVEDEDLVELNEAEEWEDYQDILDQDDLDAIDAAGLEEETVLRDVHANHPFTTYEMFENIFEDILVFRGATNDAVEHANALEAGDEADLTVLFTQVIGTLEDVAFDSIHEEEDIEAFIGELEDAYYILSGQDLEEVADTLIAADIEDYHDILDALEDHLLEPEEVTLDAVYEEDDETYLETTGVKASRINPNMFTVEAEGRGLTIIDFEGLADDLEIGDEVVLEGMLLVDDDFYHLALESVEVLDSDQPLEDVVDFGEIDLQDIDTLIEHQARRVEVDEMLVLGVGEDDDDRQVILQRTDQLGEDAIYLPAIYEHEAIDDEDFRDYLDTFDEQSAASLDNVPFIWANEPLLFLTDEEQIEEVTLSDDGLTELFEGFVAHHPDEVTDDLDLDEEMHIGNRELTLEFESSDEDVVENDGTVHRPDPDEGDAEIEVDVTVMEDEETVFEGTLEFTVLAFDEDEPSEYTLESDLEFLDVVVGEPVTFDLQLLTEQEAISGYDDVTIEVFTPDIGADYIDLTHEYDDETYDPLEEGHLRPENFSLEVDHSETFTIEAEFEEPGSYELNFHLVDNETDEVIAFFSTPVEVQPADND